jgi:Tol biopolymer transport system component
MNRRPILGLAIVSGLLTAVLVPALSQAGASSRGGEIAFSASVHGIPQVFTMKPDGTGLVQITRGSSEAGAYGLSWSRDRTHLLFSVTQQGRDLIARSNSDGSDVSVISPPCTDCFTDGGATYSPNGERIAFDRGFLPIVNSNPSSSAIFTMSADGSALTQLTPRSPTTLNFGATWSPSGKRLAFVRCRVAVGKCAIEVMSADGSQLRRITPFGVETGNPRWSPDGKRILFNTGGGQGISTDLFIMRPDGTHRVALTHYTGGALTASANDWSPDGRHIIYNLERLSGTDTSVGHFVIIDSHGKHARRLPIRITADAGAAWGS